MWQEPLRIMRLSSLNSTCLHLILSFSIFVLLLPLLRLSYKITYIIWPLSNLPPRCEMRVPLTPILHSPRGERQIPWPPALPPSFLEEGWAWKWPASSSSLEWKGRCHGQFPTLLFSMGRGWSSPHSSFSQEERGRDHCLF